jgi:6-phospho-3-hexuloisomerase
MEQAFTELASAKRVFCAGAGRSGLAIRAFAMRLMHLGKTAYLVGEIATPSIAAGDLLVIGSGSGRTESLVAMANKAKKIGARILLVTIDPNSPIGTVADCVIQIPAPSLKAKHAVGSETSIQPLGSLFEQSLFLLLDSLIVLLMRKENVSAEALYARHANLE